MSFKYHYHLLFTITQYHSHLFLTTAKYHSQLLLNTAKYYSLCYLPLQSTRYLVSFVKFSKSINPTCYLRQQSTNVICYLQRYHFLSTAAKYHYHLLLTQAKYHSHLSLTTAKYHYHLLLQQILPPLVTYNNRVPLHLLLITANYHSHFLPTTANYHFNLLNSKAPLQLTYDIKAPIPLVTYHSKVPLPRAIDGSRGRPVISCGDPYVTINTTSLFLQRYLNIFTLLTNLILCLLSIRHIIRIRWNVCDFKFIYKQIVNGPRNLI